MPRVNVSDCPICGIKPVEWMDVNGNWFVSCKNSTRKWHPSYRARGLGVDSKMRSIKMWNEEMSKEKYNKDNYKVPAKRPPKDDAPFWSEIIVTSRRIGSCKFYKCSRCKYMMTTKSEVCPNCGITMNLNKGDSVD